MNWSRNSGRTLVIALGVMIVALVSGSILYMSLGRNRMPPALKATARRITVTEKAVSPQSSWRILVQHAKNSCERARSKCSVGFDALYQYGDRHFGLMTIAWQESEYEIDLYRFDAARKVWVSSPRKVNEIGDEPDTSRASDQWKVPKSRLDRWIADAHDIMKQKYSD